MKWRGLIVLAVCTLPLAATAQTGVNMPSPQPYVPRLGDIMNAVQTRHIKLWFASKSAKLGPCGLRNSPAQDEPCGGRPTL